MSWSKIIDILFFFIVFFALLIFYFIYILLLNFQYIISFNLNFSEWVYFFIMKTIILICSLLYILNSAVTAPAAIAQFGSKDQSLFNLPSQI